MTEKREDAAKAGTEAKPAAKVTKHGYIVAVEMLFPMTMERGGAQAAEEAAFNFCDMLRGVPGGQLAADPVPVFGAKRVDE